MRAQNKEGTQLIVYQIVFSHDLGSLQYIWVVLSYARGRQRCLGLWCFRTQMNATASEFFLHRLTIMFFSGNSTPTHPLVMLNTLNRTSLDCFFHGILTPSHPLLCYVTLEWPIGHNSAAPGCGSINIPISSTYCSVYLPFSLLCKHSVAFFQLCIAMQGLCDRCDQGSYKLIFVLLGIQRQ